MKKQLYEIYKGNALNYVHGALNYRSYLCNRLQYSSNDTNDIVTDRNIGTKEIDVMGKNYSAFKRDVAQFSKPGEGGVPE